MHFGRLAHMQVYIIMYVRCIFVINTMNIIHEYNITGIIFFTFIFTVALKFCIQCKLAYGCCVARPLGLNLTKLFAFLKKYRIKGSESVLHKCSAR